jgi:hypothetical protein
MPSRLLCRVLAETDVDPDALVSDRAKNHFFAVQNPRAIEEAAMQSVIELKSHLPRVILIVDDNGV